jgi:hypothetical protein
VVDEMLEMGVSDSSVCVDVVELVDVERTVVRISAGVVVEVRLTVTVVGAAVEPLLELDVGVPDGVSGQSNSTRLPFNTCPSTELDGMSSPLQASCMLLCTLFRPATHAAEHASPRTKSSTVQSGMME